MQILAHQKKQAVNTRIILFALSLMLIYSVNVSRDAVYLRAEPSIQVKKIVQEVDSDPVLMQLRSKNTGLETLIYQRVAALKKADSLQTRYESNKHNQ